LERTDKSDDDGNVGDAINAQDVDGDSSALCQPQTPTTIGNLERQTAVAKNQNAIVVTLAFPIDEEARDGAAMSTAAWLHACTGRPTHAPAARTDPHPDSPLL
jgi:hypothetical protein